MIPCTLQYCTMIMDKENVNVVTKYVWQSESAEEEIIFYLVCLLISLFYKYVWSETIRNEWESKHHRTQIPRVYILILFKLKSVFCFSPYISCMIQFIPIWLWRLEHIDFISDIYHKEPILQINKYFLWSLFVSFIYLSYHYNCL